MEAIQKVAKAEEQGREQKLAAEQRAKQLVSEAERGGHALLEKTRKAGAENGRELLKAAEERAKAAAEEIARRAQEESEALRSSAGKRLDEAAELIVGRVVGE